MPEKTAPFRVRMSAKGSLSAVAVAEIRLRRKSGMNNINTPIKRNSGLQAAEFHLTLPAGRRAEGGNEGEKTK